jgi:hypothetical protein
MARSFLVLDLGLGPNELAPLKHQVCSSWPEEYILTNDFSALYGIVHQQYDTVEQNLTVCLGQIIDSRQVPVVSRNVVRIANLPEIFGAVIGLVNEYVAPPQASY